MKCKRETCQNEVSEKLQNSGQVYCSRSCAPFGHLSGAESTSSTPKPNTSSSRVPGAPSGAFTGAGKKTDDDGSYSKAYLRSIQSELRLQIKSAPTTTPAPTSGPGAPGDSGKRENSGPAPSAGLKPSEGLQHETATGLTPERSGRIGMTDTEKNTASQRSPDATEGTSVGSSVAQVKNFDQERSTTMSLIDESASLLRDCMKQQVRSARAESPLDYRQVNGIANLGKQIAALAKVKVDAIREARKNP